MINYHKNDLIDECLVRYYATFAHTLDTRDYVPEKYNNKILKYIFKNMKRQFRKLNRADKRYQKALKKELKRRGVTELTYMTEIAESESDTGEVTNDETVQAVS